MSYTNIKNLTINANKKTIKYTAADNNIRDFNNRLIFEPVVLTYDDNADFENTVIAIANNILNGDFRVGRNTTMARALVYLEDKGLISKVGEYLHRVEETPEAIKILTGEQSFPKVDYIITNGVLSLRENMASRTLKDTKRMTKFRSLKEAKNAFANLPTGWANMYNLQIVKL